VDYRQTIAGLYLDLGDLLLTTEQFADSEKALDQARKLFQELTKEFPGTPDYRWNWALGASRLGLLFLASSQPAKAEKAIGKALGLQRQFVKDYPKVPGYRSELANTLNGWGDGLRQLRRFQEAERVFNEALRLRNKLAEEFPDSPFYRYDVSVCHYNLGLMYSNANRPVDAAQAYRKARQIREKLIKDAPDVPEFHWALANTVNNQGMLRLESKDLVGARALFEKALRHARDARKPEPNHPRYVRDFARSCINLADVLVMLGDHAALAKVAGDFAGINWMASAQAADYLISCAKLAGKDGTLPPAKRVALACAYADQTREVLRRAAKGCPNTPKSQASLAWWTRAAAERLEKGGWRQQASEVRQLLGPKVGPRSQPKPE
jgi:tetratricopeptide (TPR) repeat protein